MQRLMLSVALLVCRGCQQGTRFICTSASPQLPDGWWRLPMDEAQPEGGAAVQTGLCIRHPPVQGAAGGYLAVGAWLWLAPCIQQGMRLAGLCWLQHAGVAVHHATGACELQLQQHAGTTQLMQPAMKPALQERRPP